MKATIPQNILSPLLFLCLLILAPAAASAQVRNAAYEEYINRYKDISIEQMKKHGIPASITMAQGLLESGAGRSELARKGNNHFGIKCHDWQGAKTYHDDDERGECFRKYNNARESFEDHSLFLKKRRYERLFTYKPTDYKAWAHGLKACGYATDPAYAQSLISIIERYELYKLDVSKDYDHFIFEHGGASSEYAIGRINGKYFVRAHQGDTFKKIGKAMDISHRKLAKYNERSKKDVLNEGDIVFLVKKGAKGDKSLKNKVYIVKKGDSMYSISQSFGIRLKNLYKINKKKQEDGVMIGERLRLR